MAIVQPDNTAVRTALWRALHTLIDDQPFVIDDNVGYELIKPEKGWEERPDMKYTKGLRASMVARARLIEDLVKDQIKKGLQQYVILGSGLDSFAQRNIEIASKIDIYEIDQAATLAWKKSKLIENGYQIPKTLHYVPVDFENSSWWKKLLNNGFDVNKSTLIACTGVTLYLTKEAILDTLKYISSIARGSILAMSFYLPIEELQGEDKGLMEMSIKGAASSGTPFISFFSYDEVKALANNVGLKDIEIISAEDLNSKYFKGRKDNLKPSKGEYFLMASV